MKNYERIQLSVKVTTHTAEQVKKLADYNSMGVAEQLRVFIEKGLNIEGYKQEIDFITSIIRQELMSIYHIDDIKAVVEQQTDRLEKMLMKVGKISASQHFLLLKMLDYMWDENSKQDINLLHNEAMQLGIDYMQLKNIDINKTLLDTDEMLKKATEYL